MDEKMKVAAELNENELNEISGGLLPGYHEGETPLYTSSGNPIIMWEDYVVCGELYSAYNGGTVVGTANGICTVGTILVGEKHPVYVVVNGKDMRGLADPKSFQ